MEYFEFTLAFLSLLFLFLYSFRNKNGLPTNWPLVGMLPALLKNRQTIHDLIVDVMPKVSLTFFFKGPRFTNMNILLTLDPLNVQHVLSKNFRNYPKGPKFQEIFDILGDGILNTDGEIWKYHRKMAHTLLAHPQFTRFLVKKIWEKIEIGLIPILDHASEQGLEIELPDLFERFTFDTICNVIMDHDPRTLSINSPRLPCFKALHDVETSIFYRHMVPTCVWKFQRILGVGQEKTYHEASKVMDDFLYGFISRKREETRKNPRSKATTVNIDHLGTDLVTLYMDELGEDASAGNNIDKFLRDTFLTFFIAGLETTSVALSWFFYNILKNPHVLHKIKQELDATMVQEGYLESKEILCDLSRNFDKLINKLIYLQAAIYESLRLYPSIAFQAKFPTHHDTLPSGHKVDPSMQIIISMYAMGRMKSIWGEDCCEFKPERWISETGKIRNEPSYKFLAFNSGPRICLGKNMSITQMKAIIITLISKYQFQAVDERPAALEDSFILHMKHCFKVKVRSK